MITLSKDQETAKEAILAHINSDSTQVLTMGGYAGTGKNLYDSGDGIRDFQMENPMIKLEKIHRQAKGDPIIRLSMMAREDGYIPIGNYGNNIDKIQKIGNLGFLQNVGQDTMTICGTNATRVFVNDSLRRKFGYISNDPEVGEKVICLKNNREMEVYNGMTGEIKMIRPLGKHWYHIIVGMDAGITYEGRCYKHQFGSIKTAWQVDGMAPWQVGDLFDWGYCMTCHKAQGSEANSVVVIEERISRTEDEWRRWLYTAVTRAKKQLLIVGS